MWIIIQPETHGVTEWHPLATVAHPKADISPFMNSYIPANQVGF